MLVPPRRDCAWVTYQQFFIVIISNDFIMKLERDGFKTHFVTIFNIFRRDEEDEQKDRRCSCSYIEDFLRNLTKSQLKILNCSRKGF